MTTYDESIAGAVRFFDRQIDALEGRTAGIRVLDFGCGRGGMVKQLRALGYDAHGCDTWTLYNAKPPIEPYMQEITTNPYRLPYDDDTFDVVVSTSVFEHAQNKEECFREIHRVLKPGGHAIHVLPARRYLPTEPHLFVPFVSWMWPRVPYWWFGLWALLGVRNQFQQGWTWRATARNNAEWIGYGLSYWSTKRYREVSARTYAITDFPMDEWIEHGGGGFNRIAKKLPRFMRGILGVVSRECRMMVLRQQKARV